MSVQVLRIDSPDGGWAEMVSLLGWLSKGGAWADRRLIWWVWSASEGYTLTKTAEGVDWIVHWEVIEAADSQPGQLLERVFSVVIKECAERGLPCGLGVATRSGDSMRLSGYKPDVWGSLVGRDEKKCRVSIDLLGDQGVRAVLWAAEGDARA